MHELSAPIKPCLARSDDHTSTYSEHPQHFPYLDFCYIENRSPAAATLTVESEAFNVPWTLKEVIARTGKPIMQLPNTPHHLPKKPQ